MLRLLFCINAGLCIAYVVAWLIYWETQYLHSDFVAYYTGYAIINDGFGVNLYNFDLQSTFQQNILKGKIFKDGLLPFVGLPHATIIFIPLAWLSLKNAFLTFSFLQFIALISIIYLTYKILRNFTLEIKILFIVCLIALFSTYATFILGNHSLFILLSILGCYYSLKKGNDFSAGAWLALGTIKPQLVLMPILMLMVGKNWKAIAGFFITLTPFVLISTFMLGWTIWFRYLVVAKDYSQFFDFMGVYPNVMYNLKGMLYSIFGHQYTETIVFFSFIGLLLSLIFTTLLWFKKFNEHSPDFELRFALTMLIGLFFSPHLNQHDFLLIFAALLFLIVYAGNNSGSLSLVKLFSVFPVLFFLTEIVFRINVGIRFPTLMMIIMMIWISWKLFKDHRADARLEEEN